MLRNIKNIPLAELPAVVEALGLKKFAANQLAQWLYQRGAVSFNEMTNLSKPAREILAEKFYISRLEPVDKLESADGTQKFAWRLEDGNVIESVLIPSMPGEKAQKYGHPEPKAKDLPNTSERRGSFAYAQDDNKRLTLCISTQVGCAMGCTFCRTAGMGHVRNLTQGEIVDQVLEAQQFILRQAHDERPQHSVRGEPVEPRITNVVLMGMGEPLANYENVVSAIKIMIDSKGFGLSKRHVTLSTCGLVPAIERLAGEKLGIKLAVSLNATTDEMRSAIMPVNKKYPLAELFNALKKYSDACMCDRLTFEYVMMEGKNDSIDDAKRLVKFLSHIPAKVNLIPLNAFCHPDPPQAEKDPLNTSEYGRSFGLRLQDDTLSTPPEPSIQRFAQFLRNKHIQVNIRQSRGADILAACGQLARTTRHGANDQKTL